MKIDQTYDPVEVEAGWYAFWMERGLFGANERSDKPPYTIVIPPPNVTGSLHMGHALFVTLQDIMIRFKRMQGYEALYLPGTDHAGIATQVVVERLLEKEGTSRQEIGREAFLQRVWEWKARSGGRIIEQLKRMGASCDWERERFTMDQGLSDAVAAIFVKMYGDGLIYRGERMVNWDPVAQTVVSDLEVLTSKDGERGSFWHLRYPLADGSGHVIVATTRPETMLGDTAVAVHPEDERYKRLIGEQIMLPIVNRIIPIIADEILPDPQKGSGAVKVTPAHDPNDFECGQRHDLPSIQVIGLDATMIEGSCPEELVGLDRYVARREVVARFEALGLLEKVESITYFPGRSERSNTIVEPLVLKQWFVRGEPLAKPAIEAVESGRTRIIPALWKKTFDHFMYNIRDWCISRQIWWGHQIPAWYGPDGEAFVALDERAAQLEATAHYGHQVELERDPDVLDTWFSSGLWPFSTLGWPERTEALKKFYPTQLLETGSDILFFWVARMMMMGLYAMGEVPFEDVYLHAMVRDERGDKMSKVKGNVIDPLHMIDGALKSELDGEMHRELIAKIERERLTLPDPKREGEELAGVPAQGADALRFTLAILAAQARDIKLDTGRMEGYRAFMNKLWNASRFALMNMPEEFIAAPYERYTSRWESPEQMPFELEALSLADRWILGRLMQTIGSVTGALDRYKFNDAAQAIYDFVWHELCDWYIELSKATLYDDSPSSASARQAARATLSYTLDVSLRLLHPVAPFITEEIWQALPRSGQSPVSVMVASWPTEQPLLEDLSEATEAMGCALEVIGAIRAIRGETRIKPSTRIERVDFVAPSERERGRLLETMEYVRALARFERAELITSEQALERTERVATAVAQGIEIRIPLRGLIDLEEERARLSREIEKIDQDIAFVSRKLNNEKFVAKAPAEIVEKERVKLADYESARETLQRGFEDLDEL